MWIYGLEEAIYKNDKINGYDRVIVFHLLRSTVCLTIKDGIITTNQKVYCEKFYNDVERKLKRIERKCAKHGNPFTFNVVRTEIREVTDNETKRKKYLLQTNSKMQNSLVKVRLC